MNAISACAGFVILCALLLLNRVSLAAPPDAVATVAGWTVPCKLVNVSGPAERLTIEAVTTADLTVAGAQMLVKGTKLKAAAQPLANVVEGNPAPADWTAELPANKAGATTGMRLQASWQPKAAVNLASPLRAGQEGTLRVAGMVALPPPEVVAPVPAPSPAPTPASRLPSAR